MDTYMDGGDEGWRWACDVSVVVTALVLVVVVVVLCG